MPLNQERGGKLLDFNVGLVAAAGLLAPLSAQIDALINVGLGPFQLDLGLQLNASLAVQASLSLQISDPLASLKLAISAVAQLQAALQAALQFPISLELNAELSASMALAAALEARLGLLQLALAAALKIKLGAIDLLASLEAKLNAGPVFAFTFHGDSLAQIGSLIQAKFAAGLQDPVDPMVTIAPGDTVAGVVLLSKEPSVSAALSAIITV